MKRLEFHYEDGKTQVELHEVTRIAENGARNVFHVEESPVYLKIFFHRPLDEQELRKLYIILMTYDLFEIPEEKMDETIHDELERQKQYNNTLGVWEIKCQKFQEAFECCYDVLSKSDMIDDDAFSFQLSDEPSIGMKRWMDAKDEKHVEGDI